MKEQQVTIKQEVFAVEQEPRAADVPPVAISAEEPTSTALISGQVDQPAASHVYDITANHHGYACAVIKNPC